MDVLINLNEREVILLIEGLDFRLADAKKGPSIASPREPVKGEIREVKVLLHRMHDARRAPVRPFGMPVGPLGKERITPPEIEEQLPPHRIEFHPDDPNLGRSCARCGFAIPRGCRYVHAEWCENRK